MKIFFVPSGYPNDLYPNSNTFLKEQAEALSKKGHQVVILNVAQKGIRKIAEKSDAGIKIYHNKNIIEYRMWATTFKQEMFPNLYFIICKHYLKKIYECAVKNIGKPDVIYAHFGFYAGAAIGEITRNDDIPIVLMEHYSYLMNDKISSIIKRIERKAVAYATSCCCVSNNLKNKLISHLNLQDDEKHKLVVVENMLNPVFKYKKLNQTSSFVFSSVGNLNARKRFDLLICAFIEAFSPNERVELNIGGSGEELQKLKQIVEDHSRNHQIHFKGSLNREQVFELNRDANCFILLSKAETFGIVYREALAVGRPIITSDHGGFDADFDCRDGILIKDCNVANTAKAMREMIKDYNLYNREDISKRCLDKYSQDVIVAQIENVLNQACQN